MDVLTPRPPADKIRTWDDAAAWRRTLQGPLVFTNGVFDLLHPGHVDVLTGARAQGAHLVVGLNSDASVRGYKGPLRPIVAQEDRARLLLGLRCVDYVHVFDEPDPIAFLEEERHEVAERPVGDDDAVGEVVEGIADDDHPAGASAAAVLHVGVVAAGFAGVRRREGGSERWEQGGAGEGEGVGGHGEVEWRG